MGDVPGGSERTGAPRERADSGRSPLLAVEGLEKHYPITEGFLRRRVGEVHAVDGISFGVDPGEALGLIGESGCGKSTAAATILRFEDPTGGTVRFDGADVTALSGGGLDRFRRRTAMVFQDPDASLDPRMTVGESAAEPLAVNGLAGRDRRREVVVDLFERVGLAAGTFDRYPHELSGGQKQRVGLARALALNPEFVVLDEPVSALDVSVQAEILTLLDDLRREFDLSLLLISHDVSVVREVCDRVAVMYAGELVERGETEAVLRTPQHPYTKALAAAVPTPDPRADQSRTPLSGDVPDPADPPSGCRFHPRCPSVIPPAETDLTSGEYRAILDLREALAASEVDPDGLRDLAAAERDVEPSAVSEVALRETLRVEYGVPDEFGDESVEGEVTTAVEEAMEGEMDAARDRLATAFSSICEREHPDFRPTDAGQPAACHLYEK